LLIEFKNSETPLKNLIRALAAIALVFSSGAGFAQDYPTKPIKWIVPYTPGGYTDNVTRLVTTRMATILGQPIIIENKPGANSIIGVDQATKAAPDGYTMLTTITAHAANITLYEGKLPFDPYQSLIPISLVTTTPLVLSVNKDLPVKSIGELIAYAKANPDKLSFGSSGVGAAAHLTSELLKYTAGINMVHVPYKGTAPALTDLMSNSIQVLVDAPSGVGANIRAGKIKALAVFSDKRLASYPDVPTIVESGGPKIESSSWVMFFAPAGTPKAIVDKLSLAVRESLKSEELIKRLSDQGIITVGSTPAEADAFLKAEIAKWGNLIKTVGVKAE
jgi:tripartite-type tricarboxylate transporter receptor subunit TctC